MYFLSMVTMTAYIWSFVRYVDSDSAESYFLTSFYYTLSVAYPVPEMYVSECRSGSDELTSDFHLNRSLLSKNCFVYCTNESFIASKVVRKIFRKLPINEQDDIKMLKYNILKYSKTRPYPF